MSESTLFMNIEISTLTEERNNSTIRQNSAKADYEEDTI